MNASKLFSLVAICSLFLGACATTEYQPYEARNNLFEGTGGTKIVIEGVEFWENGDPPRKFKILGIIDDQRPGGAIPMSSLKTDIARKAKEVGGDAVVVLGNISKIVGYVGSASGGATGYGSSVSTYGTATAMPARKNYSKFAVIKYVE